MTEDGVIKQETILNKLQTYDIEYINNRYNTYGVLGMQMAFYRLGYLIGQLNKVPSSILDVGYGNGDFLRACKTIVNDCFGNDVSEYQLPTGVEFIENIFSRHFEVITFFDVLEHFENIEFVQKLNCDYILISLPWCHYTDDIWFKNWKHRRPDEHLWHFNDVSLIKFFDRMGYEKVSISNIEDAIRISNYNLPNILTGLFKKRI
jgi:hypothetical protein